MSPFPADRARRLCEPLLERGWTRPQETAVIFIGEEGESEILTVGALLEQAAACGRGLANHGLGPGDLVLLSLGHCRELLYAFWGAQLVGAVPVILPYKSPLSTQTAHAQRLLGALRQTGARLLVTQPGQAAALAMELEEPAARVVSTERLAADAGLVARGEFAAWPGLPPDGEAIAYVQFTSGTTGSQKMVELSQRAVCSFIESLHAVLGLTPADVVVNWLPLYHDFGLFAGFIFPLLHSCPVVLISPYKWLRDPLFVLKAIQKHHGTITLFPNSAHNHTRRCAAGLAPGSLDLSSLRLLINGSEPIRYESQQQFLDFFSAHGLRESALASGYGMAENTLCVTFSPPGRRCAVDWVDRMGMQESGRALPLAPGSPGSAPQVSSGRPLPGVELAVFDPQRRPLGERCIGEIAFRSPFLFSRYRGDGAAGPGRLFEGWFFSGDLGYQADGELYVCGRSKDLIIVGGHNIHPTAIEAVAAAQLQVSPEEVVAFGLADEVLGTERVVVVCGLRSLPGEPERASLKRAVRQRVLQEFAVAPADVRLVRKNWLVKTQNGKIARGRTRDKYLADTAGKGEAEA